MHRMLLLGLCFILSLPGGSGRLVFAADEGVPAPTARAKLERLLVCQQSEKDAALAEKRRIETHLQEVYAFRAELTDAPNHRLAVEKAEQALAKDRGALGKVEERIRVVHLHIEMTLRAIKYLPDGPAAKTGLSADASKRRILDWWADGGRYSREVHGQFMKDYGFVNDAALEARLEGVLSRLQMMSPRSDVSIKVKVLANESGYGAAATATTVYFDKAYLDTTPSESELLFVAAHEIAHVQLGHFSEYSMKLRDEQAKDDFRYVMGTEDRAVSNERGRSVNADAILEDRLKVRLSSFSKDQELQADLLGAQQALAAGASPKGIQEAMTRMVNERQAALAQMNDFDRKNVAQRQLDTLTADHPEPEERLNALEDVLGEKFWEKPPVKFSVTCRRSS